MISHFRGIVLAVVGVCFGPYNALLHAADNTECQRLNKLWSDTFHQQLHATWPNRPFSCPSPIHTLARSVDYLYSTPWILADGRTTSFYSPLILRIKKMSYRPRYSRIPMANAITRGRHITVFDEFLNSFNMSNVEGAAILIHESEHMKAGDPEHEICRTGAYQGFEACDAVLDPFGVQGSGYSAELGFYYWIRNGKQTSSADKESARWHARHRLLNNFNQVNSQEIKKWE